MAAEAGAPGKKNLSSATDWRTGQPVLERSSRHPMGAERGRREPMGGCGAAGQGGQPGWEPASGEVVGAGCGRRRTEKVAGRPTGVAPRAHLRSPLRRGVGLATGLRALWGHPAGRCVERGCWAGGLSPALAWPGLAKRAGAGAQRWRGVGCGEARPCKAGSVEAERRERAKARALQGLGEDSSGLRKRLPGFGNAGPSLEWEQQRQADG